MLKEYKWKDKWKQNYKDELSSESEKKEEKMYYFDYLFFLKQNMWTHTWFALPLKTESDLHL